MELEEWEGELSQVVEGCGVWEVVGCGRSSQYEEITVDNK